MGARLLLAAVFALIISACAPLVVTSYLQTGADMSRYRTYAWASNEGRTTGDARLDNNPFFDRATREAIDAALARHALTLTPTDPHLLFHYHVSIKQQLDLAGTDSTYLTCEGCSPTVFEAGTLVIDAVDARTNQLLWRGWAEGSFDRLIDDQAALEKRIGEAAARIIARYPLR
jgi:hypothetical protein